MPLQGPRTQASFLLLLNLPARCCSSLMVTTGLYFILNLIPGNEKEEIRMQSNLSWGCDTSEKLHWSLLLTSHGWGLGPMAIATRRLRNVVSCWSACACQNLRGSFLLKKEKRMDTGEEKVVSTKVPKNDRRVEPLPCYFQVTQQMFIPRNADILFGAVMVT